VALVAVAAGAARLDAHHAVADVLDRLDVRLVERRVEARPAGAALELGLVAEQRQAALAAAVDARRLLAEQAAAERRLGAVVQQDAALFLVVEVGLEARALVVGGRGQVEARGLRQPAAPGPWPTARSSARSAARPSPWPGPGLLAGKAHTSNGAE
jgi:hypothetical protein